VSSADKIEFKEARALENLLGRVEILERRLQLIFEELSGQANGPPGVASAPADSAGGGQAGSDGGDDSARFEAQVYIDADSISAFAHGFYPREYDSRGVMFRWTGNGPLCELRFFIDRSVDRHFRLNVGDTTEDITGQVRGFVDYAPIRLTMEENENASYIVGTIPKRAHTRLAVASFLLGELVLTKEPSPEAPDWLGFKFYSFEAS
jgi:hypothetical protein